MIGTRKLHDAKGVAHLVDSNIKGFSIFTDLDEPRCMAHPFIDNNYYETN